MVPKTLVLTLLVLFGVAACSPPPEAEDRRGGSQKQEETADPNLPLRAVSLRFLQQQLADCAPQGRCPAELLAFGGLTRILGYSLDRDNGDILIYGLADPNLPRLHVDDFVIALRSSWGRYAQQVGNTLEYTYPGCDIRPDPALVLRLQEAGQGLYGSSGSAQAEAAIDNWEKTCDSLQTVSVLGLPFDSHFGQVMVQADYDMKRLADGSDKLGIPGVVSAGDLAFRQAEQAIRQGRPVVMKASMNRFWLTPGDPLYDQGDGIIWLRSCPVQIRTHAISAAEGGELGDTEGSDPAAEDFAHRFSALYDQVAEQRPIYRELQGLFHLFSLSQVLRFREAPQEVGLNLDYLLDEYPVTEVMVARQVPGRHRVQRFRHERPVAGGTEVSQFWMPSCGGVEMRIEPADTQFRESDSALLSALWRRIREARPGAQRSFWNVSPSDPRLTGLPHRLRLQQINRAGSPLFITVEDRGGRYYAYGDGFEFEGLDTEVLARKIAARLEEQPESQTVYVELQGFSDVKAGVFTRDCELQTRRLLPGIDVRALRDVAGTLFERVITSPSIRLKRVQRLPQVTTGEYKGFFGVVATFLVWVKGTLYEVSVTFLFTSAAAVDNALERIGSDFSLFDSLPLSIIHYADQMRRELVRLHGFPVHIQIEQAGKRHMADLRRDPNEAEA